MATPALDEIINLRNEIRKGILGDKTEEFLLKPAVDKEDIAAASKILLYHYHRCYNTDDAENHSIAAAALLAREKPDSSILLRDFYAKFRLDTTQVRLALADKIVDTDVKLYETMKAVMFSSEINRSKKLLEVIADQRRQLDHYERLEKTMEELATRKAREMLEKILPPAAFAKIKASDEPTNSSSAK